MSKLGFSPIQSPSSVPRVRRRFRPVAALVLVALCLPAIAAAQGRTETHTNLQLNGDFLLTIDGTEIPDAEIYQSERNPALLIRTSKLESPMLLIPGRGSVSSVHIMKMSMRPDGGIDLLPGAALRSYGRFTMKGQDVVFSVDGKELALKPMPPLLGLQKAADLKTYSSLYVRRSSAYNPDESVLESLKAEPRAIKVRIYFGSWCHHCQRTVPGVVRVAEELAGSKVEFEFYGLPRGFSGNTEAKRDKVTAVPTGIVYLSGKEIGRIKGDSWVSPERSIKALLSGGTG